MQAVRQIVMILLKFLCMRSNRRNVRMIKIAFYFGVILSGMLMKPRREKASNEVRDDQRTGQAVLALLEK